MEQFFYDTIYRTESEHWWYRVRRSMVRRLIRHYGFEAEASKPQILDVGCGVGAVLADIQDLGECYGVDASPEAVEFCRKRNIQNIVQADSSSMPYPSNRFDIALCLDVLEHVGDDLETISEIYRVLKPGGIAIIFVPAFSFLWGTSDVVSHHLRRYTRPELLSKAKKAGFSPVRSSYFNTFLFLPILIARLAVKTLRIPIKSENEGLSPGVNSLLHFIFYSESLMLRRMNFPFGVSVMAICKK